MPKHLLEIDDLSAIDIAEIIRLSHVENPEQVLRNKGAALLFEKPSNRTRNSMEMAIIQDAMKSVPPRKQNHWDAFGAISMQSR